MDVRKRRALVFAAGMVGAWTVAVFIASELIRPSMGEFAALDPAQPRPSDALGWRLARSFVGGMAAGLLATLLELKILPRKARRYGVGVMLLFRTVAYSVVAWVSVLATVRFVARQELSVPLRQVLSSEGFQAFVHAPEFGRFILMLVVAGFIISAAFQVARLLGPGVTTQILLGRYLRPAEEDRTFLFIDLADSTGLAERLGALNFAELKNDFFHDIAEPVLTTRGQIVQYVGDEVLVTWKTRGVRGAGCAVECFFMVRDAVLDRAGDYRERYGEVPRFRAGLHGGKVVVSQLGDIKREIVFSGDVVNTAARIQGQCRVLESDFLASADVLAGVALPERIEAAEQGKHQLRGRARPVHLVSLLEASPALEATPSSKAGNP